MKIAVASLAILLFPALGFADRKQLPSDAKEAVNSIKEVMAKAIWRDGKLDNSSQDVCQFKLELITPAHREGPGGQMISERVVTLSFSLADIDPSSVKILQTVLPWPLERPPAKGHSRVRFYTTNLANDIRMTDNFGGAWVPFSMTHPFDVDDAVASQVVLQLKQAAQVCGAKQSTLPLERVYEFDLKTASVPGLASGSAIDRYPYHICKEISRDVQMEGNTYFQRYVTTDGSVVYGATANEDNMFGKHSGVIIHAKILETLDLEKSKCGKLIDAFPLAEAIGPAFGWVRRRLYIEGNITESVEVHAPEPDEVYCDHQVQVYTREGGNGRISVSSWDMKSITVSISEDRAGGLPGGAGEHLGIVLFGRFLKRRDLPECTELPPAGFNERHQRLKRIMLPDGGSMRFAYDPANNPSGTPH